MGFLKERKRFKSRNRERVWRTVVSSMGEEDVGRQTSEFCFGLQDGESRTEFVPVDHSHLSPERLPRSNIRILTYAISSPILGGTTVPRQLSPFVNDIFFFLLGNTSR